VTGATGFLGARLVARLLAEGLQVKAIGRNLTKGAELQTLGATFYPVDFADGKRVMELCEGVDVVFHCGALSTHSASKEAYYTANVLGTQHIVDGCLKHKVARLIHVSTPSLYFRYNAATDVREDQPLPTMFANEYARTKAMAEDIVHHAAAAGLSTITIRPRAIFGEGDQALMPNLFDVNAKFGVPLFRKGQALMDVTYVDNVVHALLLSMRAPETCIGQTYNITNGSPMPFLTILTAMFSACGIPLRTIRLPYRMMFAVAGALEWLASKWMPNKKLTLTRYTLSVLAESQTLSIEKAKRELNYTPVVTVSKGIARYGAWVKERGTWK
jgi:nucleoside-diphosphate-sugar epimerase